VPSFPIGSPLRRPRWPGSSHTVRVYGGVRLNLSRRHTQVSSYIVSLLSFVRLQLPGIQQCFSLAASPRDEKVGRDPLCFTTLNPQSKIQIPLFVYFPLCCVRDVVTFLHSPLSNSRLHMYMSNRLPYMFFLTQSLPYILQDMDLLLIFRLVVLILVFLIPFQLY